MSNDMTKQLNWSSDFSKADEFEFNNDEMYEVDHWEFEMNEERYFIEDGVENGFVYWDEEEVDTTPLSKLRASLLNDRTQYNRDLCLVDALHFYAMVSGLKVSWDVIVEDEQVYRYWIYLESSFVDATLNATFLCEFNDSEVFERGAERVDVLTDLAGNIEYEMYSMMDGFYLTMAFIDFANHFQPK